MCRILSWPGIENRYIGAAGNLQLQILVLTLGRKIIFYPLAQSAGIVAHDVVVVGIVALAAAEHMNANSLLRQFSGLVP